MKGENSETYINAAKEWVQIAGQYKNPDRYEPHTVEDLKAMDKSEIAKLTGSYNLGLPFYDDEKSKWKFQSFPNAAKFLRLGFHDCLTYENGSIVNGCDGCLNPTNINYQLPGYGVANGKVKGNPIITFTDNNNLLQTADVLEEVYTNASFPTIEGDFDHTSAMGGGSSWYLPPKKQNLKLPSP